MPIQIFFCYAHEDELLLNKLKTHLRPLQRQGLIDLWHDRDISAGTEWEREISQHLNSAQIILLLVSPDFMNSDYCYGIEMKRAIERHERGDARVIPVILRPVYWHGVLGKLQALPTDAKPVMSSSWNYPDAAFLNVTEGICTVIEQVTTKPSNPLPIKPEEFTLIRTLEGHSGTIYSVAISSDGQTLVSGGRDQTIRIWKLTTGELLRTLKAHSDSVRSVEISGNGQTLASGSADKTVRVWNLHTGELLRTLTGHSEWVRSVAIDDDGHIIASGSWDKTIKIWGNKLT